MPLRTRSHGALALGISAALARCRLPPTAPSAVAATCDPQSQNSSGDLDGDNVSDVAAGMPNVGEGSGAVDVRGTSTPDQRLTSDLLGGSRDDNDQVGAAIRGR
jgi:hypothetical protein